MPCTLDPWEIEYEERRKNKAKYGLDLADAGLMTKLLCEAVTLLTPEQVKQGTPALQAWAKGHRAQDRKKRARSR